MGAIDSSIAYIHAFGRMLVSAEGRGLLLAHARPLRPVMVDREALEKGLQAAAGHLCLAQDHSGDGGLGSYHMVRGWGATYPETTGYIIPTLLKLADRLRRPDLRDRAIVAGDALLALQHANGGWMGGRVGEGRPPLVFNTAQVIRGLLALHREWPTRGYLEAAQRAAHWIVGAQESDGAWRAANFMGVERTYDTYVDAPLLALHMVAPDASLERAARLNLDRVLSHQRPNGWFANADNTLKHNDRPITHTIAYTLDGFLRCGVILHEPRYVEAARKGALVLLERFLRDGRLHGRYDPEWQGSGASIVTGCAQLAIIWKGFADEEGGGAWREGCLRMAAWLLAVQERSLAGPADMHGAVTGSFPLWGRYEKFACPNWAVKYTVDALLCTDALLER